jgi:two-component system response regulator NreC
VADQISVLIADDHTIVRSGVRMLLEAESDIRVVGEGAKTSELISAVRIIHQGEVFLYPSMTQKLVQGYIQLADWDNEDVPSLSPREKEIFQLLAEGYSNKEIAEKLVISPSTVYSHRSKIMDKLGLGNRRELIQYARKRGLIQN